MLSFWTKQKSQSGKIVGERLLMLRINEPISAEICMEIEEDVFEILRRRGLNVARENISLEFLTTSGTADQSGVDMAVKINNIHSK